MELGHWTAPEGHRVERYVSRDPGLSLQQPPPLPSTAPVGRVARDLYYYDSWVPHPGINITPAGIRAAFVEAEHGYPQLQVDMFDDLVEGDGTARNLFEHRERVVANKPVVFTAGDNTDEGKLAVAAIAFAWQRLNEREMREHLLRFNRYGYMGVEVEWGLVVLNVERMRTELAAQIACREENPRRAARAALALERLDALGAAAARLEGRPWVVPVSFLLVPARRFRIGVMGMVPVPGEREVRLDDLRLYNRLECPQGDPLAPGKWLVLKNAATQIARAGLMRTATVYLMAKRMSFRDWIIVAEKYGIPLPIASYDESSPQAGLDAAKQVVQRIGTDGGAALPKGIEVKVVEGVKGDHPMHASLIAFCNAELGKLVNGSTLRNDTKDSSGASYALGNIHDQVAWDEVRRDGTFVSEAISLQICAPFCQYNSLTCQAPTAQIIVEPDLGPIEATSLMVKGVNELGIDVSVTQWRQLTGMRAPIDTGDKAKGMQVAKLPITAGGNP